MISIKTKQKDIKFILNPENGKWIYTNNPSKYHERIQGNLQLCPLKGTQLVLFNVGRQCNLRCKYCFIGNKRKENKKMSLNTAKCAVRRVSEMSDGVKQIVFHGSEPLLNLNIIKETISYGRNLDRDIKYSIQTNGTLLTSEIIDFFVKNEVYIGISLDGLRKSHNQTRPFSNGKGSYDKVIKNLKLINKIQGRASFITVITKFNVGELDKIVELGREMKIRTIAFNPVLSSNPAIIPDEQELADSLIKITDSYFNNLLTNVDTPRLEHVVRYLSMILHMDKQSNSCLLCQAGPSNPLIAIDIDGTIYPCDHFWGEKKYAIGNIKTMTIDNAAKSPMNFRNDEKFGIIEDCFLCEWKRICSGGCPGGRIVSNKAQYCDATKRILEHFVKWIPILKENGLLKQILCD